MTSRPMPLGHRPVLAALLAVAIGAYACGATPPTPTPTFRPLPVPSTDGSQAASASATPLPSVELAGEVDPAQIRRHLEALEAIATANDGVRTVGTPGYDASVDYVADELRALGYEVDTPTFRMATFQELPGGTIRVGDGGATFSAGDDFHAMIYSAGGDLTAEVAVVEDGGQGCAADDWDDFPAGAIALTPPGPCRRLDEVQHAQEAGAVALVVAYPDWEPGEARRPTLIQPQGIEIPVLSAIGEVGEALTEAAEDETEVSLAVDTVIGRAVVRNVIAESGDAGPVAMVGAHLDSVHDGPGINDNVSGVAAVLEIARLVASADHAGTVRFGLWAAEEFGLHGSGDYARRLSETAGHDVVAYLNLDMLGSLNGVPFIYRDSGAPRGSESIADYLTDWLATQGVEAEPEDTGGGSDHYFFAEGGIPTGGIFSGATELKSRGQAQTHGGKAGEPMDACYHLACDTADNVDVDRVALYAEAAARAVLLLARGELLPPG